MSAPTGGRKDRNAKPSGRPHYDKELVRERTLELLVRRLGPGKDQGARVVWDCPECGKREKYSVKRAEGKGGCLVEACRLGGYDDAFGMLAKLEYLDYHADFIAVLRRAYDLLGLEPSADGRSFRHGAAASETRTPRGPSTVAASAPPRETETESSTPGSSPRDFAEILELATSVYERILSLCPLKSRDRGYLRTRGLSNETISKGRFGTMTAARARNVKATLQPEFGREALLSVPGFSEDEKDGRLKFTLTGEYILIPYHDAGGRVTTIEGRCIGEPTGGVRKYVSLRGSGNHLYLFPGHKPERLLAVCEGAMGAIVAAEFGLSVGAIQGCERFRASPSFEMLDGARGDPLLELKGADFGGRTVPYIPDADYPPNPNVLRAAPKAARWLTEPQNGVAAICLLPKGADLDEWLLSLDPSETGARFAELLAAAHPPEDGENRAATIQRPADLPPERDGARGGTQRGAPPGGRNAEDRAPPSPPAPGRRSTDRGGEAPSEEAERKGSRKGSSQVLTPEDVASRKGRAKTKGSPGRAAKRETKGGDPDGPQPGLWDDVGVEGHAEGDEAPGAGDRRPTSRGARKLRDEVYHAMLDALPIKETHLEALGDLGVMRATARVGAFSSVDARSARKVAADLRERFGAKKLLTVPGFEADGVGKVRISPASHEAQEHLLIPCFDAEGMLSAVEGLPFDPKTRKLDAEHTVPLSGAGSHLYVFAHYSSAQIEGFCEGPLGAMLAAQEDVVIGATGGFRRYKAASGPGEGRQPAGAVLPELEGEDFAGRRISYCPRAGDGVSESNARYHEAIPAARWLVERQNGRAVVVGLGDSGSGEEADGAGGGRPFATDRQPSPTSLAEWILALPEEEAQNRLHELFPESPLKEEHDDARQTDQSAGGTQEEPGEEEPPPPPSGAAYYAVGAAALLGGVVDLLLLRIQAFAGYVSPGPGGVQLLYAGALGPLRQLADSGPLQLLYDYHAAAATTVTFAATFALIARTRRAHLARWRASRMRLEDRWKLHLNEVKKRPSRVPLTTGEVLAAALAWPIAYVLSGWIIALAQWGLSAAEKLQLAPEMGPLVEDPQRVSIYAACVAAAFVLWRRRAIRGAELRMHQGKIRH